MFEQGHPANAGLGGVLADSGTASGRSLVDGRYPVQRKAGSPGEGVEVGGGGGPQAATAVDDPYSFHLRDRSGHAVGCGCTGCVGLGVQESRTGGADRASGRQPFDAGDGGKGAEGPTADAAPGAAGAEAAAQAPAGQDRPATAAAGRSGEVTAGGRSGTITYVAVAGDTLATIAAAHRVSVEQLKAANPGLGPPTRATWDAIVAGDRVTVPDAPASTAPSAATPSAATPSAATPAVTPPALPPPAPLTIVSRALKAAPDGSAATRSSVGVGEQVELTGSEAGAWSASSGTPTAGASARTFTWKAGATAGTADIALTVGTRTQRLVLTVVAPSSTTMVDSGVSDPIPSGTAGVCMFTNVTLRPLNVCLGQVKWLEVPGPATNVTGYYTALPATDLDHHPSASYHQFNDANAGLQDHCASHAETPPYSVGTYDWVVPNKYIIAGEPDSAGRQFSTNTQAHAMAANGRMTVSKAGASKSRSP